MGDPLRGSESMGGLAKGHMFGVVPLGGSQTRSLEGAGWGKQGDRTEGKT